MDGHLLEILKAIADGVQKTFGKNCEVVIHDLSKPENSMIYKAGDVTKRDIGAPVTNVVLEALKRDGNNTPDLIGYKSFTKEGKNLKSSTIFIRNSEGEIVGCLCINYDLTEFQVAQQYLAEFTETYDLSGEGREGERFVQDIGEMVQAVLDSVLSKLGKPVAAMTKEDKVRAVEMLEEKGIFLVKGAVDIVAQALAVSKYTLYGYLEEVRGRKNSKLNYV
ncbi:MAG: helix-turn-helix transcriptional regulator [Thermanaeromonas sp.]|uniref:helix-turn-helix transcriptional regulator n=1 Tax=Thermanaeromonas sp. TaxID=2003697 RepID=UPI002437D4AF|nr:helix-turn-helix transcriptional regulator [Thermanaeromonas sp.]MCG0278899.1 helix-turn-helix transcriptional regulator [Thermanaeromonas sp.]